MNEQIATETIVTRKIRDFVGQKTEFYHNKADEREQYKDKKVQELVEEKDKVHGLKEEAEKEIENLTDKI